jgi:hypothetical protein
VVEDDAPVVDTGQTALVPAVGRGDAGKVLAVLVADRHQEAVHAIRLAAGDELGEHRRHRGVLPGVADVVLARPRSRGVDDELLRGRVERGRGLEILHVAAVAGLRHGEAADEVEVDQVAHVGVVVVLGAEVLDRAAEEAPLDAGLDHEREVELRQHLDAGDRGPGVAGSAVLLEEPRRWQAGGDELLELTERALSCLVQTEVVVEGEVHFGQLDPGLLTDVSPLAVEGDAQLIGQRHGLKLLVPDGGRSERRPTPRLAP